MLESEDIPEPTTSRPKRQEFCCPEGIDSDTSSVLLFLLETGRCPDIISLLRFWGWGKVGDGVEGVNIDILYSPEVFQRSTYSPSKLLLLHEEA